MSAADWVVTVLLALWAIAAAVSMIKESAAAVVYAVKKAAENAA